MDRLRRMLNSDELLRPNFSGLLSTMVSLRKSAQLNINLSNQTQVANTVVVPDNNTVDQINTEVVNVQSDQQPEQPVVDIVQSRQKYVNVSVNPTTIPMVNSQQSVPLYGSNIASSYTPYRS